MITASQASIGQTYDTSAGIRVEVLEIDAAQVVVKSLETGNRVVLPLDYKLDAIGEFVTSNVSPREDVTEEVMSNETDTVEAPVKKVKKSTLVDEGLKANLTVDQIVKNVQEVFPETLEKAIRNLVSVRRSKLKKLPTT